MSAPPTPEVLLDQSDLLATSLGRVVVMLWRGAPRRPTIEALRAKVAAHHERYRDGVVLVVSARGGAPDDDARSAFKELVRGFEKAVVGVAVLLPIGGLRGTVVRGAVNTAIRALRLSFGVKVLETASEVGVHAHRLLADRGLESPGARVIERVLADDGSTANQGV